MESRRLCDLRTGERNRTLITKSNIRRILPRLLVICLLALHCAEAWSLLVGVGECDITPDVAQFKVPMAGYGARMGKPSTGVHDPIRAKILLLKTDDAKVAIITTDLRSITPELKTKTLAKAAGHGFDASNVMMCASHSHSGPSIFAEKFWQIQFGKHDPQIVEIMSEKIAKALRDVDDPKNQLSDVTVGIASKSLEGFTKNRRWEYDQPAREAAGETPATDPVLTVIRFNKTQSNPKTRCGALFVNFPTHPTILGADNMQISAEWPGVLQLEIESDPSLGCYLALYSNGAEGDQSPITISAPDAFKRMEEFGKRLASETKALAMLAKDDGEDKIASILVEPELPEIVFSEGAQKGPNKMMAQAALDALPRKAAIQIIRIGDIALVGLPGEPICEVGIETRRRVESAGAKHVIIIGLANDYIGYILNEKEYKHGGYEVDSRSYYGPNLGEFIAAQAGEAAKQLWKD